MLVSVFEPFVPVSVLEPFCSCFSSCLFGGTCIDGINAYRCVCARGYSGTNCEHLVRACDSTPCLNDATCTDLSRPDLVLPPAYQCHCAHGFAGRQCEQLYDWCAAANDPCRNGAVCRQEGSEFGCECAEGWDGEVCDMPRVTCAVAAARKGTLSSGTLCSTLNLH